MITGRTISPEEAKDIPYILELYETRLKSISFLPLTDHDYAQAPYQECSHLEYELALAKMPAKIDWTKLAAYEDADNTVSSQTLACSGGVCELVDIGGAAA